MVGAELDGAEIAWNHSKELSRIGKMARLVIEQRVTSSSKHWVDLGIEKGKEQMDTS